MTSSKNIQFDPFFLDLLDPEPNGAPQKNDIDLHYYKDPKLTNISSSFAFANEEKPIMIGTDFYWNQGNNYKVFKKHGDFKCRFTSQNDASR